MYSTVPNRHWLNDYSFGRIVAALWDSAVYLTYPKVKKFMPRISLPSFSTVSTAIITALVCLLLITSLSNGSKESSSAPHASVAPAASKPAQRFVLPKDIQEAMAKETPSWVPDKVGLVGGEFTKPKQAFDYAHKLGLPFISDRQELRALIASGALVPIDKVHSGLSDVSEPYALPETRNFVRRLAKQYTRANCGKLIVTSALRLTGRQPPNASEFSVHPTGMSVDFRVPQDKRCRDWVEQTLMEIEGTGRIDATRERKPAHFHVVVVKETYANWLNALLAEVAAKNSH